MSKFPYSLLFFIAVKHTEIHVLHCICNTVDTCVQVYPHVATGFSDTSAFLRELTLKSMLVLAPKVHLLIFLLSNLSLLLILFEK